MSYKNGMNIWKRVRARDTKKIWDERKVGKINNTYHKIDRKEN